MGIIFVVLNIVGVIPLRNIEDIVTGIIFALINAILIFGAHTQNSTALLVWMILGGIEAAVYAVYVVLLIIGIVNLGDHEYADQFGGVIGVLAATLIIYAILAGMIIWTIIITKRAREEIN